MTPYQRAEALRLTDALSQLTDATSISLVDRGTIASTILLLRSLAAEPERKPLTQKQIRQCAKDADCLWLWKHYSLSFPAIVRATERAHGIGD